MKISFSKIFTGILLSIGLYIAFSLWGDISKVKTTWTAIPWTYYIFFVILVLMGYIIRFIRWHYLLNKRKIYLKRLESFEIFLMGMSMSLTPGRMGELLKSFLIKKRTNIEATKSASVVFMERFTDLVSILFLTGISIGYFSIGYSSFILSFFLIAVIFFMLKNKRIVYFIFNKLTKIKAIEKHKEALNNFYEGTYELLKFKPLFISTVLGCLAWFLESYVLYTILATFHLHIDIFKSIFIFSFGTLLGALSMIPGGLGVSEGSITGVLIYLGIQKSTSVGITMIIRVFTFWFGTIIGFLLLTKNKKKYNL